MSFVPWLRRLSRPAHPVQTRCRPPARLAVEGLEDRSTPTVGNAFGIGGISYDYAGSIAADAAGNTYVAGQFIGYVDFDPSPGSAFYLPGDGGSPDVFVAKYSPAGVLVWAKQVGGTGNETVNRVAVDPTGNVILAGDFLGTADFDSNPGSTYNLTSFSGTFDAYVLKLDSTGNFVWAGQFGGGGHEERATDVATDGAGNVYAAGYFYASGDYDPSPTSTYTLTNTGGADSFVVKLDPAGRLAWARQATGPASTYYNDYAWGVAVDRDGNVAVTGQFEGTIDFDPSGSINNLASAGGSDTYVWRLGDDGGLAWARSLGGVSLEYGNGIAVDGAGNVYVAGGFYGAGDFDPGPGQLTLTAVGNEDVFLAKLDAAGNAVWARRIGGSDYDWIRRLTLDTTGGLYVAGQFTGTADFDPGPGAYSLTSAGGSPDGFVVKLGVASGNFDWVRRMGGLRTDSAIDVAEDRAGNAYVTGHFYSSTADFSLGSNGGNLVNAGGTSGSPQTGGSSDVFVAKVTARADLFGRTSAGEWWAGRTTGAGFVHGPVGTWDESAGWQDTLTGDFNADGRPDVLGRTSWGEWWLGAMTPDGAMENRPFGDWNPTAGWADVLAGDFDGNGLLDVAGRTAGGHLWVGRNTGSGLQNELWGHWSTLVAWEFVAVADMNGDGRTDLVGKADNGDWWVAVSSGPGSFINQAWSGWSPNNSWVDHGVGDFNGDGRPDVIARVANGAWWVGLNNGGATYQSWNMLSVVQFDFWNPTAGWRDVRFADFDGDGRTDVAGRTSWGQWWVGRSTGGGFVTDLWDGWNEGAEWRDVLAADFDGDGRADLAGRTAGGEWYVARSTGGFFVTSLWATWNEFAGWQDMLTSSFLT